MCDLFWGQLHFQRMPNALSEKKFFFIKNIFFFLNGSLWGSFMQGAALMENPNKGQDSGHVGIT